MTELAAHIETTYGWMTRARCRHHDVDPDLHYPTPGDRAQTERAKALCKNECEVRRECEAYIMEVEATDPATSFRYGIFAGLTPAERYKLAGQRPRRSP